MWILFYRKTVAAPLLSVLNCVLVNTYNVKLCVNIARTFILPYPKQYLKTIFEEKYVRDVVALWVKLQKPLCCKVR